MTTSTAWPECANPGCDNCIYYKPDERTVCEACRLRGGPPPPPPEPPKQETEDDRIRAFLLSETPQNRQWHLDNIRKFNTGMADQWEAIARELDTDA